jgi:quercetin dioxygenase-like cupin family protein
MQITRAADRTHKPGSPDWFTGEVDLLEIAGPGVLLVTFAARARTAWHTHPHGQTLHIVSGTARAGREGGPVEELQPGDAVHFAPGERHWHGAAPGGEMSHVAIAQTDDEGRPTYWEELVSDADYGA